MQLWSPNGLRMAKYIELLLASRAKGLRRSKRNVSRSCIWKKLRLIIGNKIPATQRRACFVIVSWPRNMAISSYFDVREVETAVITTCRAWLLVSHACGIFMDQDTSLVLRLIYFCRLAWVCEPGGCFVLGFVQLGFESTVKEVCGIACEEWLKVSYD